MARESGRCCVIDPYNLQLNGFPPSLHVEHMVVDCKTYDIAAHVSEQLRLAPHMRGVDVDYTALIGSNGS